MLELTSAGRPVHLSPGTSTQLELNSPLFDEDVIKGQFSYSFPVPAGPNGPLYGFPERPDGDGAPGALLPAELSDDGLPLLVGQQRIKTASTSKYSVSVQAGLSGANLSERALSSFEYGGLRDVPRQVPGGLDGGGNPVFIPGLVQHANQVVANPDAYGYVFAPLRNEYLTDDEKKLLSSSGTVLNPTDYPPATVNKWVVYPGPIFGMPAGGSFTYSISFAVPGGVQLGTYSLLPYYCPFPKLRYVLQAIFEESGLLVDVAQLLPGELGDLVIVGNAQLVDRGDLTTLRFSLADVLPAMSVAELLAAIRQDLGIVVYVDPATRYVRTVYLAERVAASAEYVDLTTRLAGDPEATIDEAAGLTLTYKVDSEDELTKDLVDKQPDLTLLLPAVATLADLPHLADIAADNPQNGQVRLVQALDMYYVCALSYLDGVRVTLTWTPLVLSLAPLQVNEGGDEQARVLCYTATRNTLLYQGPNADYGVPLPALSQPPYLASQKEVERSSSLRLLFYNGLQLAPDGVSPYPQLSAVSASGARTLYLGGTAGTYAQLLSAWLAVKLRPVSYKVPLLLTPLDLARLDLTQPLRLDGVPYLVRKVQATVPLQKPATLELVRL
ncbi:hypothetical protein GO988_16005 [Hymenobacter sp. HMF4947]|uniref:Uncharacterized protein n=1 Tax=Hymenobacter ginkgonis TaxID=2682976 RepID=A0A7K1THQ1_9BACT|nr:hypothetical protein [Hymenobacter ginkgonis]MVN77836.1 hypothetical protein [Hymenobacter ginkgonis]